LSCYGTAWIKPGSDSHERGGLAGLDFVPAPTEVCLYAHARNKVLVVQVLKGSKESAVLTFVERDGAFAELSATP